MQLKFTIRSLLLLVAVVAAGTSLQVRLQNVLSAVEHDFAHVGSSFHQQTIEEAKAELRSMHDTPSTYHAFEEKLARNQVKGTPFRWLKSSRLQTATHYSINVIPTPRLTPLTARSGI